MKIYDYAIIGGGIIGLSTAMHLSKKFPKALIILLEKELAPGMHQTGRNSGVIHSGVYYEPKSLKAYYSKSGSQSMVNFCREHQIPYNICGKIIIATKKNELVLLDNIYNIGINYNDTADTLSYQDYLVWCKKWLTKLYDALEDDGRGFTVGKKTGRGLSNIRSRASLVEAEVAWQQRDQGGTIFILTKPKD